MKRIPAGGREFVMGRNKNVTFYTTNNESVDNESPQLVSLQSDFYLGVFELTQYQWDVVCCKTINAAACFTNATCWATRPMENISWYDLHESFTNAYNFDYRYPNAPNPQSYLGLIRARTGVAFELPSEVEWEFASNTGLPSTLVGDGAALSQANLNKLGRTYSNWPGTFVADFNAIRNAAIDQGTAEVGSYQPNLFGLYDMNGNAWEWCLDQYDGTWNNETDNWYANAWNQQTETYNGVTVYVDPVGMLLNTGANTDKNRVLRGGSVDNGSNNALSSYRHMRSYDSGASNNWSGFRLACPVPTL